MNVAVPRWAFSGLVLVVAALCVIAAFRARPRVTELLPYDLAIGLFVAATILSVVHRYGARMPIWMAIKNVAVVVAMALLVSAGLTRGIAPGAGWHVGGAALLMVLNSSRERHAFAWLGMGAVIVESAAWHGPNAILELGLIGATAWVAVAHLLSHSLSAASRDAFQYVMAEREAAQWRAAQEARVFERQFRLAQTSRAALPILSEIVAEAGDLSAERRKECLHIEDAIRDEIRGRRLLNDAVRREVMASRRRGSTVTLLDEGGVDDLSPADLDRVLTRLASAIRDSDADRIIARTVPNSAEIAVTVVGVSTGGATGNSEDDEELDLWLEIPRRQSLDA